ncbi:hypothetical protein ACFE04_001734 [Oxalis oulophora]
MPRPGPRPYECVRRAWHSDRHQPTRGSIIQQIFRLVKESHSLTTTKKKEWQEKLPFVVLKAEEIMYSKANSEAEYVNLDTLWDRLNDAVNTIIRRDESTEVGELLPPCVEAALNLGCIPVRASRSQRHCLPRSYLPRVQEHNSSLPSTHVDVTSEEQRGPQFSPVHSYCPMNYAKPTNSASSTRPISDANAHMTENCNRSVSQSYPYPYETVSPAQNQLMTVDSNLGSVYPLYYGSQVLTKDSQLGLGEKVNSNTIFVGTPVGTSVPEPSEKKVLQNFLSSPGVEISSKRFQRTDLRNYSDNKLAENECDLNLRLGRSSNQGPAYELEDVSISSQDQGKFNDISTLKCRELCFFTADEPSDSKSTKWFFDGESQNLEATVRKRKTPYNEKLEDGQLFWQSKVPLPSNQFVGHFKSPGL